MKKVKVRYIGCSPHVKAYGEIHERYLLKTKADLDKAYELKLIGNFHVIPMKLRIANKETIVLNDRGGWCTIDGTWEIV